MLENKIMKFRKFKQNKLWRDKAVELMEQTGSKVHWTKLNDSDFLDQLKIRAYTKIPPILKSRIEAAS